MMATTLVPVLIVYLVFGVQNGEAFPKFQQAFVPTILVHGGAGDVTNTTGKYEGTKAAVRAGYEVLENGGNAMDAVVEAIKVLEDHPAFNAGRGSALTMTGHVEMDSSIMNGTDLSAGAVASITNIRHPILAARMVMEQTEHVLLAGDKATQWAIEQGIETADEDEWLITEEQYNNWLDWLEDHNMSVPISHTYARTKNIGRRDPNQWKNQKGTVGAVVIDLMGNLAAGTSTGGLTGKLPGRVGDTPGIGHGTFADNMMAAVSCTGTGETFIKAGIARRVAGNIGEKDMTPNQAIDEALDYMSGRIGGDGGVIAISRQGDIGYAWNSNQMSWAYGRDGKLHYGVNPGEDFVEDI